MKIGKTTDTSLPTVASNTGAAGPAAAGTAAAGTAAPAASTAANPSATIELSTAASTLLSGGVTAEFDAQKVAQVSQSIDAGQYKINPQVIADKLISNAQELLSKSKS